MDKDELRKLQKKWYKILEDIGFEDAEKLCGNKMVLKQTATYAYRKVDPVSRIMKEEYFRIISQTAQAEDTDFANETHRYILLRHSEGAKIKTIMEELEAKGISRARNSIRFIIRRYEMAWGIKSYAGKQLNRYG